MNYQIQILYSTCLTTRKVSRKAVNCGYNEKTSYCKIIQTAWFNEGRTFISVFDAHFQGCKPSLIKTNHYTPLNRQLQFPHACTGTRQPMEKELTGLYLMVTVVSPHCSCSQHSRHFVKQPLPLFVFCCSFFLPSTSLWPCSFNECCLNKAPALHNTKVTRLLLL